MRLLLVEDDPEVVAVFEVEFAAGTAILDHAGCRDDAMAVLAGSSFDAVVCDLRIPSTDGALDDDVAHGRAVLTTILETHPGTPIIAFSAYGTVEIMQDLLRRARQEDFLGEGTPREMLVFYSKDQLPDCVALLHGFAESVETLGQIEIAVGLANIQLPWEDERILRVYARRLGASVVRVSPLTGGLSGSRVLRLRLEAAGAHVASVVAKLDTVAAVCDEQHRVETLVAPVLPSGSYPSAVTLLRAGAGSRGGIFYRFAGGYDRSLFDAVAGGAGAEVVAAVRQLTEPWREGAPVEQLNLETIRNSLVQSADLPQDLQGAVRSDESVEVSARRCTTHGDLHLFNVLVPDDGQPMIIDFAAVGSRPASVDPVTLELSMIFHPDAREVCGEWPSTEQAEHWDDLNSYVDGCPHPDYIRACRLWAFEVAAGDREVFASLYAYSVRQLKFEDTPHAIALALVACARRRLGA